MFDTGSETFLRRLLYFDAATCIAAGLLLLALAGPVEAGLAIPAVASYGVGWFLAAFGVAVALVGSRPQLSPRAVASIAALNGLWVVGSILVLLAGWLAPGRAGTLLVLGQAIAVGVIAELQVLALLRRRHGAA